jgi:hypothetical protein
VAADLAPKPLEARGETFDFALWTWGHVGYRPVPSG